MRHRRHQRMTVAQHKNALYAPFGRLQEMVILGVLRQAKVHGGARFLEVILHPPHSPEDKDGKDFTVRRVVGAAVVSRSFGVTISYKRWTRAQSAHPDVPQFYFPVGVAAQTIIKQVLELFASP